MPGIKAEPYSLADFERLRDRIPPLIRFGTSTWNYPGWRGLVYHQDYGPKGAAAKMLKEYAAFPLFGTVGVDSSFYGPPTEAVLRSYAEQLPPGFPCVSKVWSQLTVHTFTKAQDPDRAGKVNPDFLNPDLFIEEIYEPYQRHFSANTGPFVFEFQTIAKSSGIGPEGFADRLDEFFARFPAKGSMPSRSGTMTFSLPCTSRCCGSTAWATSSTPGPGCLLSVISSICPGRFRHPSLWPGR